MAPAVRGPKPSRYPPSMRISFFAWPAGVGAMAGCANSSASEMPWVAAVHHQDDVGLCQDGGLVGELLVAGIALHRVHRAGKLDDGACRRSREPAARIFPPCMERMNSTRFFSGMPAVSFSAAARSASTSSGKRRCLLVGAERLADDADLLEDAGVVEGFRHRDEGHARLLQHVDRFLGAAALDHQKAGRIDRQHAFRRERAHIADVGQLQRGFGIEAGRIARDELVLFAKRIDDLGDRAADRGDARRVLEDLGPFFGGSDGQAQPCDEENPRERSAEKHGNDSMKLLLRPRSIQVRAAGSSARKRQSSRSLSPSWRWPKNWMIIWLFGAIGLDRGDVPVLGRLAHRPELADVVHPEMQMEGLVEHVDPRPHRP